jgi:hypothetical protein
MNGVSLDSIFLIIINLGGLVFFAGRIDARITGVEKSAEKTADELNSHTGNYAIHQERRH